MPGSLLRLCLLLQARKYPLGQEFKMTRLAKKLCLIGRDAIDHQRTLVLLIVSDHQVVVLRHRGKSKFAQAASQPSGEQRRLVFGQPDSTLLVDQSLELSEELWRDRWT